MNIPYLLATGKHPAKVNVIVSKTGETGNIVSVDKISANQKSSSDAYLISTIGDEYDLKNINKLSGFVAVDLQGYVRTQKHNLFTFPERTLQKINLIKATESELKKINPEIVKQQKRRILLVTKGSRGFSIFYKNHGYHFNVRKLVKAKNTIGARDTLFAIFVVEYLKSKNISEAACAARTYVKKFLSEK